MMNLFKNTAMLSITGLSEFRKMY